MNLNEFKRELRSLLRRAGVRGYRYAAVVVHGRGDGPDEVIVVGGRRQREARAGRGPRRIHSSTSARRPA